MNVVVTMLFVEFVFPWIVVAAQAVVESVQVAPVVKGQWILWGGVPAIESWTRVDAFPGISSNEDAIFTIASVSTLNQISAGIVRRPSFRLAVVWYAENEVPFTIVDSEPVTSMRSVPTVRAGPVPETTAYSQKSPDAHVGRSTFALAVPGTIAKATSNNKASTETNTRADRCIHPILPPQGDRGL